MYSCAQKAQGTVHQWKLSVHETTIWAVAWQNQQISIPVYDLKVKVTDTECFMLNFVYLAALVDICDMPSQGYFKSWQK